MKLEIEGAAFLDALTKAAAVVPTKALAPILGSVKIATNDDKVTITASDMDRTMEIDLPASVETEGAACVPFAVLRQFVSAARKGSVTLAAVDGGVKASSGRSRVTLHALPVNDFPTIMPEDVSPVSVSPADLSSGLSFAMAAASKMEAKWQLSGVWVAPRDGGVDMAGADGRALHVRHLAGAEGMGTGMLPPGAAEDIVKVSAKAETAEFGMCPTGWLFSMPGLRFWGRCIDSTFVDYGRFLADPGGMVMSVKMDAFRDAMTIASCGAEQDSTKSQDIVFAPSGDGLSVRGRVGANGVLDAGRAEVDASFEGDPFAFGLASKAVLASLAHMGGEFVKIRMAEAQSPAHVSSGDLASGFLSIISPIRLGVSEVQTDGD